MIISVDNPVEFGDLGPFIARFTRLASIRIEFPKFHFCSIHMIIFARAQNVTEEAWNKISLTIGKCSFLKSMELVNTE